MDKRIVKTKKSIKNAFFKLLSEKEFNKISMKEIAEYARVDRKTLYNYYKNINDLFEDVRGELVENFEKDIDHLTFETVEDGKAAFFTFSRHLAENLDMYSLILKNDNSILINRIVAFLKRKVRAIIDNSGVKAEKIELAVEFLVAGVVASYLSWFNAEEKIPLEEFTLNVAHLILVGFPAYFNS